MWLLSAARNSCNSSTSKTSWHCKMFLMFQMLNINHASIVRAAWLCRRPRCSGSGRSLVRFLFRANITEVDTCELRCPCFLLHDNSFSKALRVQESHVLMFRKHLLGMVSEDWVIFVGVRVAINVDALFRLTFSKVRKYHIMFSAEKYSVVEAPRSEFLHATSSAE